MHGADFDASWEHVEEAFPEVGRALDLMAATQYSKRQEGRDYGSMSDSQIRDQTKFDTDLVAYDKLSIDLKRQLRREIMSDILFDSRQTDASIESIFGNLLDARAKGRLKNNYNRNIRSL